MIIALFPNTERRQSKNLAKGIIEYFANHHISVVAEENDAKELNLKCITDVDPKEIKFLISMGGDGSILRYAHHYAHLDAALLGINLGHLGFMADVPISDIYPSLQDLINGAYTIEERVILDGVSIRGEKSFAMNDIVIHRAKNRSLVELSIHVDDRFLNTFQADGIIIATPNGSTAYSLAAGGPILYPALDAFVLTPICPHTISNRPIVLSSNQVIQVQYLSPYEPVEVVIDGIDTFELATGEVFRCLLSKKKFKLVNLMRHDYFSTLRTKLGWVGKLR